MGPKDIKLDVYNVMTNSRELTNYCQESVNSENSNKISQSLNNFQLNNAVEFITKLLLNEDQFFFDSNQINFVNELVTENKPIYNKVIDYIKCYLSQ